MVIHNQLFKLKQTQRAARRINKHTTILMSTTARWSPGPRQNKTTLSLADAAAANVLASDTANSGTLMMGCVNRMPQATCLHT
jgi:hypothetical protein